MLWVMVNNLSSSSLFQCVKPGSKHAFIYFVCYFSFAISHLLLIQIPLSFYPIYLLSLTPPFHNLSHAHHPSNSLTPHPSSPPLPLQPTNTPQDCTAKAITHRIQKIKSASPPSAIDPDAATPASSPTKAVAAKKPRASPTKKAAANGKGKEAAAKGKAIKRKHDEIQEDGSDATEGEGDKKMKVKEENGDETEEDENAGAGMI